MGMGVGAVSLPPYCTFASVPASAGPIVIMALMVMPSLTSGDAMPASAGSTAGGAGDEAPRRGGGTMVGCWLFRAPPHFETVTGGESRRRLLPIPSRAYLVVGLDSR